jgi:hypothetical protein
MFELPDLKRHSGIATWCFEQHRAAISVAATAVQDKPVVARHFMEDLITGDDHRHAGHSFLNSPHWAAIAS